MYRALKSFSGAVSMRKGEVKAITDKEVIADLLRCGYIEEVKEKKPEKVEIPAKAEVKEEKPVKAEKPVKTAKKTKKK